VRASIKENGKESDLGRGWKPVIGELKCRELLLVGRFCHLHPNKPAVRNPNLCLKLLLLLSNLQKKVICLLLSIFQHDDDNSSL
jgi:hypothetical protein